MRKDVCFGVIALTWLLSAVLASPLAIFREYGSLNLEPGHSIQVTTDTLTLLIVRQVFPWENTVHGIRIMFKKNLNVAFT